VSTRAQQATNRLKKSVHELWRDGNGWILVSISLGWFLSIGVRLVYPAIAPFFRTEFELTLGTTGFLLTVLWGAYAIGHIPGGVVGDRFGEGRILVISSILAAATVLAVATAVNVWMLFAATITFGLATALFGPMRFTVFTDIYEHRAGSAVGITMAAGSAGNVVLPIVATAIATYLTWRYSFLLFAPFFLLVAIALWRTVPARTSTGARAVEELSSRTIARIWEGISHGVIPTVVLIQICFSFMFQGFTGFYPTYLIDVKGVSPTSAATLFGLFFAMSFLIQPLAGAMMDRIGSRPTLIGILGVSAIGLWLLPFVDGLFLLVAVTVVLSILSGCAVVTQTYIADELPADMKGTGLGTVKAGWMLIGATSPLIIGALGDSGYFAESFLLLAAVGTIGLVITVTRL